MAAKSPKLGVGKYPKQHEDDKKESPKLESEQKGWKVSSDVIYLFLKQIWFM